MKESKDYLEQAKAYQKKKQALTLFHLVLTPALLLVAILAPVSLYLKSWAIVIHSNPYLVLAFYFVFFTLYSLIFDLPVSFYSGFTLEHRFGLSNQTFAAWLKDFLKKGILSFLLSLVLIEALYTLIWHFPFQWWLFAWAGYALVSYGLGKIFPVWIVPLFYKYGKVEAESLRRRIVDLAARYQLPIENVYTLNLSKTTKKANAAFMGMGKTKRVVLSDTLIDHFTEEEIETVVAHELGHFKHRDIWKQLSFGLIVSLFMFWTAFHFMDPVSHSLGFGGVSDVASLPLLFLIFFILSLILMPLQNAFSRRLERAADRFALKACPDRNIFISCMDKLGKVNLADPSPHAIYEWFFYDHPAISKRIRMAEQEKI